MEAIVARLMELARPVLFLPAEPPDKRLPPDLPALVWQEDELWMLLDQSQQVREVLALAEDTPWAELSPLLRRSGVLLLLKGGTPKGLLDSSALATALLAENSRLQAILDVMMDITDEAVTIIDEKNTVRGWNKKAQQLYKIPREDITGRDLNDFFSSLVVTKQLHNALSGGEEVRDKYHQPMLGTHVMINAAPVLAEGEVIGAISSEREITQTMRLSNELARRHSQVKDLQSEISKISRPTDAFSRIYGQSAALKSVLDIARRIANTDVSILLRGESGTGKELFAEAIHRESGRGDKPFVVINCGAIPANLFESELFGYLPGSFTGADKKGRKGKFDEANGGAIFLDEVGELPLDLQVKLLRVLQNQRFTRVGGGEPVDVDVRVISATHRDLEAMIKEGGFREDLYYRLNVMSLEIPPLRERREDISQLTYMFVREFCTKQGIAIKHIEPEVINYLLSYSWPGNIRELRNVAERMVVLSEGGQITAEHLPSTLRYHQGEEKEGFDVDLTSLTDKMERQMIIKALDKSLGDRSKAAKLLGIPRSTLYYKLSKYGIEMKKG